MLKSHPSSPAFLMPSIFRTHPFTTKFHVDFNDFIRNVTSYENLNYLLAITDILITDYSTIIYDCVIAGKPFICFGYDYEEYKDERGFYFDLNEEYPGGVLKTQDEVFAKIKELASADNERVFADFRKKYVQAGGKSTGLILDELYERLK